MLDSADFLRRIGIYFALSLFSAASTTMRACLLKDQGFVNDYVSLSYFTVTLLIGTKDFS